jgi:hypothetical protein
LGWENTKFFHAKATEKFRQNTITQILNEDGIMLTDHQKKATEKFLDTRMIMILNKHGDMPLLPSPFNSKLCLQSVFLVMLQFRCLTGGTTCSLVSLFFPIFIANKKAFFLLFIHNRISRSAGLDGKTNMLSISVIVHPCILPSMK